MQKRLLGLDQLQNHLIRDFSILTTLIIYGLGSIRAKIMKANPLKRSKISTLISTENVQRICTNHQSPKKTEK